MRARFIATYTGSRGYDFKDAEDGHRVVGRKASFLNKDDDTGESLTIGLPQGFDAESLERWEDYELDVLISGKGASAYGIRLLGLRRVVAKVAAAPNPAPGAASGAGAPVTKVA